MKVLIIEDERLVAEELTKKLLVLEPDAQVLEVLDSVESGKAWLKHHETPDLILSDIQLSDGVSFEIFEEHAPECPLIFTTAYDEYAIRAFKLNSLDYLLKPIREEDLKHALDQFKRYRESRTSRVKDQFKEFIQDLNQGRKYKSRFTAHHGKAIISVALEKVSAFEKDELIFLLTRDGSKLITDYHTLDELEELLDPDEFFRANRQFVVRISAISDYKTHYSGKVYLHMEGHQQCEVIVSREKAAAFKRWFEG